MENYIESYRNVQLNNHLDWLELGNDVEETKCGCGDHKAVMLVDIYENNELTEKNAEICNECFDYLMSEETFIVVVKEVFKRC